MVPPIDGVPSREGHVLGSVHHRCLTCPSVPGFGHCTLQRLTCPRQHPFFKAQAPRPGIRPVIQWRRPGGASGMPLVSCWLSSTVIDLLAGGGDTVIGATGIRFLDILFPPENSASLTVGLPTRHQDGRDSAGVPVFRTHELRPGWVPPVLRGGGVLPTGVALRSAPAISQRPALHSASPFHRRKRHQRGMRRFTYVHPSGLLLARHPRVEQQRFGFHPGFAPRGYPRRTPGRGRPWTLDRVTSSTTDLQST